MNPGYDRPDYAGSVRPIYYECMSCHNGYPSIPSRRQGTFRKRSICNHCLKASIASDATAPGQSHVDKASSGAAAGCNSRCHSQPGLN